MLISSDGTIFMPVDLPVTNSEGFWFLESSSVGSIFLDVLVHRSDSFGVSWGSLFISNSDCTAFNEVFSYSNRQVLEKIIFQQVIMYFFHRTRAWTLSVSRGSRAC